MVYRPNSQTPVLICRHDRPGVYICLSVPVHASVPVPIPVHGRQNYLGMNCEKLACHAVPAVALLLLPSLVCTLTRTRTRQAIESRTDKKQTLAGIYQYITDTYPYFGTQDPTGWQNSIRHNLSLNKNFKRVPRGPNEPGKGAFWSIEPSVYDKIVKDLFKRKSRGPKTRSRPKKPPQK